MLKNKLILIIWIILFLWFPNLFANFDEEYYETSIDEFVNSPSEFQIEEIEDETSKYCELVYLEATRRREYTSEEIELCWELFEVKKQQELDYINYTLWKRWIFY